LARLTLCVKTIQLARGDWKAVKIGHGPATVNRPALRCMCHSSLNAWDVEGCSDRIGATAPEALAPVLCGRVGRKSGYVPGLVTLTLFARKGVATSLVLFARLFYFVSS